jgi:hypothetical protein
VIFRLGGAGTAALSQGRSDAIRAGGSPNTVAGQCTEAAGGNTRLSMTVNGTLVGSALDAHGPGPIPWHGALVVYRGATSAGTEVRFTDFSTVELPAPG